MNGEYFILRLISSRDMLEESRDIVFQGPTAERLNKIFDYWISRESQLKNMGLSTNDLTLGGFLLDLLNRGFNSMSDELEIRERVN